MELVKLKIPMKLKRRTDLHLARKTWHFSGVMFMVYMYNTFPESLIFTILGFLWLTAIPFDILRLRFKKLNEFSVKWFSLIMRQGEVNRLCGNTFLIIGVTLLALFFPKPINNLALLNLAVVDPLASLFGIMYGKDKIIGNKSLQGTLAAFVASTLIALGYFYHQNIMVDRLLVVCILSGLIGALSELVPVGKLDDNLTLPILCASFNLLLFHLFGGLA